MYNHYLSANDRCTAVAGLDRGDQVRVTDADGRVLEGEVSEAPTGSDALGRVVRRFMAGGQKCGLYVPVDPEGGLVTVDVMYNGNKASAVVVEVEE